MTTPFSPPSFNEYIKKKSKCKMGFASDKKLQQTFAIILPNLIHKSKKLDLNR